MLNELERLGQVAFQTGYLTIKDSRRLTQNSDFAVRLGPPNAEVLDALASSFFFRLAFNKHDADEYARLLLNDDFEAACQCAELQAVLRAMPPGTLPKNGMTATVPLCPRLRLKLQHEQNFTCSSTCILLTYE